MSEQVNSFLADLKSLTNKEKVKIKVPSINKFVEFKPLTVKQQKDALKANLSGTTGSILFLSTVNDIIEENSEEDIEFTIQDRAYVILQLRNSALGEKYTLKDKVLTLSINYAPIKELPSMTVEQSGIKLILEVPTLKKDSFITNKCVQEVKNKQIEDLGEVVDVLYVYEIMKFIKTVVFNENEIDFENLSIKDKKEIINLLPLSLNKQILQKVSEIKSYDKNYLVVEGEELSLDVSLLTSD